MAICFPQSLHFTDDGNVMKIMIAALLLIPFSASAGTYLSRLALFNRCYSQITGIRPAPADPLTKQVVGGQTDPIGACLQVLNKAVLSGNGNTTISNVADPEALAVLKNMHRLHASWFSMKDFTALDSGRDWLTDGVMDLWDSSTPALYITKSLFDVNPSYRGSLTGNTIYIPVRAGMTPTAGVKSRATADLFALSPMPFAPRGALYGVTATAPATANYSITQNSVASSGTVTLAGSLGGGLLGNYTYALMNVIQAESFAADGGTQMPRRWGRAIYHDLLCRDLPVVRNTDADAFVVMGSSVAFRRTSNCASCHASMDRVASVVRNVNYTAFGNNSMLPGQRGAFFVKFPAARMPSETAWPSDPDASYAKRPPTGTLFFRNYMGNLVDIGVSGPGDLANQITNQDDFYICAAKRYYAHFTGISVDTSDIYDPNHLALSAEAMAHRNEVINLGKSLRQHNSLRKLISDILNTPQYHRSDSAL